MNLGKFYNIEYISKNNFPVKINFIYIESTKYKAKIHIQNNSINYAKSLKFISLKYNSPVNINGGFYNTDFKPNGLWYQNNKIIQPISHNDLLSSVVYLDDSYKINIITLLDFENNKKAFNHIITAFQTGPIFLNKNKKFNSKKLRERSIILQFKNNDIGLMHTSPITLEQTNDIIEKFSKKYKYNIDIAVNLDGGSSAGIFIKTENKTISKIEKSPIKEIISFFPS